MSEQQRIAAIRRAVNYSHLRNEVKFNTAEVISSEVISNGAQSRVRLVQDRSGYEDALAVPNTSKRSLVPKRERVLTINRVPFQNFANEVGGAMAVYAPDANYTGTAVGNRIAQLGFPDYPPTIEALAGGESYRITPNPKSIYFRGVGQAFTLMGSDNEFLNMPAPGLTYDNNRIVGPATTQFFRIFGFTASFQGTRAVLHPENKSFIIELSSAIPAGFAVLVAARARGVKSSFRGLDLDITAVQIELSRQPNGSFRLAGSGFTVDENGFVTGPAEDTLVPTTTIANTSSVAIAITDTGSLSVTVLDAAMEEISTRSMTFPSLAGAIELDLLTVNEFGTSPCELPIRTYNPMTTPAEPQQ